MIDLTSYTGMMFLQGGSVVKRLRGVNSRFESGGGGVDKSVALYALALLGSVLAVVVIRRLVLASRWKRLAGPEGFGLSIPALKKWWPYLRVELRQDPNRMFDSKERISSELERLVDANEEDLARQIHECWIRRSPEIRHPLSGMENLLQTETIFVRNDEGRVVLEGYLRRIGQDAVDVVPFRKTSISEIGVGVENVDLERAAGCEAVFARILKTSSDGRLWTFSIGDAAKVAHQRLEFRINTPLRVLIFDKRLQTLRDVEGELNGTDKPTHHLIAKQRREGNLTYTDLLKRKKMFFSSRLSHLDDLSALGARVRVVDGGDQLGLGKLIFVHMPFEINGQQEEFLVEAEVVEAWSEPTEETELEERVIRLRFNELSDAELQKFRRLVNVLNSTPDKAMLSAATELHEEFQYNPVQ